MYEVIIGRNTEDRERFGLNGTVLLGKHYVKMGQVTSLSSPIYLDVNRSHVVFVCGKRGSGKSYSLGVVAEGISDLPEDVAQRLSVVIFDTMGIFWTMKYPNHKDALLLKEWGLEGKGLDVQIYTPTGYFKQYKEKGIPTDFPFSLKPSELAAADWCMAFDINPNDSAGVLIERTINKLRKQGSEYSIDDIIKAVNADTRAEQPIRDIVENQFLKTIDWGVFSEKGTSIAEFAVAGKITVLDISCYATMPGTWGIRSLIIGIISQKLFIERMVARKAEEFAALQKASRYFAEEKKPAVQMPMVWLVLDEAHEFLPAHGKTAATNGLITILREGREPGISLLLATQQPGKIHTDVITQADVVIAHRVTARVDVDALGMLMQSYMRHSLDAELNILPRVPGAALVFDDINERLYPMRVRPRLTWHGGEAPTSVEKK